ncbi:MAG: hypothetical protein M1351_02170 [Candidatus Thermoplasmatota archaeon]|nr:hypothetical protein [Candidatus Sysuiplasma jiujiangense]MCL5252880.1 hypothetical protein [Candidatus Thermoplasmatota archaeon]
MTEVEEAITNSIKNFEEKFRQERLDSIREEAQEDNPNEWYPDTFWCESDMKYWMATEFSKTLRKDGVEIHTEVPINESTIFNKNKVKKLYRMINEGKREKDRVKLWKPDLGIFPSEEHGESESYALMEFMFVPEMRKTPFRASSAPEGALRRAFEKLEIKAIYLQSAIECEITGQGWIVLVHELLYEFVSEKPEYRKRFDSIKKRYPNVRFNLIGTTYKERAGAAGR